MCLLGQRGVFGPSSNFYLPRRNAYQPRNHAEQRGFSSPVASGDQQGFATGKAEIQARKDPASATAATEVFASDLHQLATPAPGKLEILRIVRPIPVNMATSAKIPFKPARVALR
jgi:hypothetical protein